MTLQMERSFDTRIDASQPRPHPKWEVALLALLALGVRLVHLDQPAFIDEFHHILAASSLLETGSLAIHDGAPYTRARLFTLAVAGMFSLFGESLVVARIPAVLGGVLLILLLFIWLRAEVGRIAAWTGALLLCFAPVAIQLSQWVRFYTLHALFFWMGALGLYWLVAREVPVGRRWWIGAGSAVALLLAFHLQITTVVGIGGLLLFALVVEGPRLLASIPDRRRRWMAAGAGVLGLGLAAAALLLLGFVDWLMARGEWVQYWALGQADNPRFYHWLLTDLYGFLWVLFPLAALLALAARWKPALLFATVFGVAIIGHSIAAWKEERYIFYLLPAFFALWGMAAGEALPWIWNRLVEGSRKVLVAIPEAWRRGLVALCLALALGFAATGVTAYTYTRQIYLQGQDWSPPSNHLGERYTGHANWVAVAPRLAPLADSVDVVVGHPHLKLIHYLGDLDYVLFASHLRSGGRLDVEWEPQFTVSRKVGRPVVSEPEAVRLIMDCYATGLVVVEEHVWGWRGGVPRPTADLIVETTRTVELPEEAGIRAFRWTTSEPEKSAACEDLRRTRREAPVR